VEGKGDVYKYTLNSLINIKGICLLRVFHSQSLSSKSLKPWVIAKRAGEIIVAHCDCMTGLGESCAHAGVLAFHIEAVVRIQESKTVADNKAYWLLPTALDKAEYREVSEIDFATPEAQKRQFQSKIHNKVSRSDKQKTSCFLRVGSPTDTELEHFYENLLICGSKPAV